MSLFNTAGYYCGIIGELFTYFWSNKRWWITPILVILFLLIALLSLAQTSAIAPFVYTFF